MSTNVSQTRVYQTLDFFVTQGAVGSFAFASNPAATKTLTLNGSTVTFVASGATGLQVNIGATLAATLASLVALLNSTADTQISKCTYWTDGANLAVAYDVIGTAGNAFTLATTVTGCTPSGATLANGGTWNGICLTAGKLIFQATTSLPGDACALWARSQNYDSSAWLNIAETIVGGGTRANGRSILQGWSTSKG